MKISTPMKCELLWKAIAEYAGLEIWEGSSATMVTELCLPLMRLAQIHVACTTLLPFPSIS